MLANHYWYQSVNKPLSSKQIGTLNPQTNNKLTDLGCNRFAKPNLNQFGIFQFRAIG